MKNKEKYIDSIEKVKISIREGIEVISEDSLKEIFGEDLYNKFMSWSRGSTRMIEGYYIWDVKRFINNIKE